MNDVCNLVYNNLNLKRKCIYSIGKLQIKFEIFIILQVVVASLFIIKYLHLFSSLLFSSSSRANGQAHHVLAKVKDTEQTKEVRGEGGGEEGRRGGGEEGRRGGGEEGRRGGEGRERVRGILAATMIWLVSALNHQFCE